MTNDNAVQWFEGYDGEIALEDSYLWILRGSVTESSSRDFPLAPRRVRRTALLGATFVAADGVGSGRFAIHVDGGLPVGQTRDHPDVIRFSDCSNSWFRRLKTILNRSVEHGTANQSTPADELRAALDRLESVATFSELTASLGYPPDAQISVENVTWGWVRNIRVAVGGEKQSSAAMRVARINGVQRLEAKCSRMAGTKALRAATAGSPLGSLSMTRLASLWESLIAELPNDHGDASPPTGSARPRGGGAIRPAIKRAYSPVVPRVPNLHRGAVDGRSHPPASTAKPVPPRPSPALMPKFGVRPPGRVTIWSGSRMRVYLDVDGLQTKALYDPDSGQVEITSAPYRALLNTKHADPHLAVAAVMSVSGTGDEGPFDGWAMWILDDKSNRPLGDARHMRRPTA